MPTLVSLTTTSLQILFRSFAGSLRIGNGAELSDVLILLRVREDGAGTEDDLFLLAMTGSSLR